MYVGIYSFICRELNNLKKDKNYTERDLSWYVIIEKNTRTK